MSAPAWNRGARGLIAAASLALCLAGIGTVTQGVAVPVKARVAQRSLDAIFAQRLAANRAPGRFVQTRETPSRHYHEALSRRPRESGDLPRGETDPLISAPGSLPLPTSGPIARITVARLGVKEVVLAGAATHDQLARGPALLKQGDAASPVTVLAAHRDTHFLFVRDLRAGDEVRLLYVTGVEERYRVTRFETVRWDAFAYPRDPAQPLLALATCYPFGGTEYGGPLRRVAWAERVV